MADATLAPVLTAILGDLIAIPSAFPPGNTSAIATFAADRLRRAGYDVTIASRTPGTDNVVARLGSGRPSLVFNAHADTVDAGDGWTTDPYRAVVKDGLVFGLGAGNCKASMAVHLWLAEVIAAAGGPQRGEVVFTFVGDEENLGPEGTSFLRDSGRLKPDMLVLGAQTENQLIAAERGVMWARITARGTAAHAGAPQNGDNAILRMVRCIGEISARLMPRLVLRRDGAMQSTINLGRIAGGHNTNVVPALCTLEIDRRLLPNETVEDAFAELQSVIRVPGEPADTIGIELLRGTNGFRSALDGALVTAFADEIAGHGRQVEFLNAIGVSDGRYFANDGIPILNFGPGSGKQGHAANESVPIDQMVEAAVIQYGVVRRLLGLKR